MYNPGARGELRGGKTHFLPHSNCHFSWPTQAQQLGMSTNTQLHQSCTTQLSATAPVPAAAQAKPSTKHAHAHINTQKRNKWKACQLPASSPTLAVPNVRMCLNTHETQQRTLPELGLCVMHRKLLLLLLHLCCDTSACSVGRGGPLLAHCMLANPCKTLDHDDPDLPCCVQITIVDPAAAV